MAGGHTHLQMVRQHRGTLLVNPGSLGLPFESYAQGGPPKILPHAEYAIVECVRARSESPSVVYLSTELRSQPLWTAGTIRCDHTWYSNTRPEGGGA